MAPRTKKTDDELLPSPTAVIDEITTELVKDFAADPALTELSAKTLAKVLRTLQVAAGKYAILESALGTPAAKPAPVVAPVAEAPKPEPVAEAPKPEPVAEAPKPAAPVVAPRSAASDAAPESIILDVDAVTKVLEAKFPGTKNPRDLLTSALRDGDLVATYGQYNLARAALSSGLHA